LLADIAFDYISGNAELWERLHAAH
jgi:hypothetical protein